MEQATNWSDADWIRPHEHKICKSLFTLATGTCIKSVTSYVVIFTPKLCYFDPGMGAKYGDQRVCLSARILKTMPSNFTSFSIHITCGHGSMLLQWQCNTLFTPVLWITSCFHIMERTSQSQRRRVRFVQFTRWRHRGRSVRLQLHLVLYELYFSISVLQLHCLHIKGQLTT